MLLKVTQNFKAKQGFKRLKRAEFMAGPKS